MKIVSDEDLGLLHQYTQALAKKIAENTSNQIIAHMNKIFLNDEKIGDLTYSGMMTFINTIGSHIFCRLFAYSCDLGAKWPDAEHCGRELFEEVHAGLRLYLNMPAINLKEHAGGIKKVGIKED